MTRLKRPKNEAWEKVTAEELFDLSFRQGKIDCEIAELYGVKPSQVSYKRNKFNLKYNYNSPAMLRLTVEQGIEALTTACGMSESYKQKYRDITAKYFTSL